MKMILALVVLIVAAMPTEPPVREKAPANPVSVPTHVPSNPTVPSFTADQANKGQILFYENCAECHGAQLEGNAGPALDATHGNVQWETVSFVFSYMSAFMPAGNAHGLSPDDYLNILAFLLKAHGHHSGVAALTAKAATNSKALLGP
jgi:polar amino acid transport system substrate-binding protein